MGPANHQFPISQLKSSIFLTGFMGSGKSYTGTRLARLLGVPFIDLDERIESTVGKTITDIFADEGEAAFREHERQALRACLTQTPAVVATGGGAPCFHDGMAVMNDHGLTVFIDPVTDVLLQRLRAGRDHRPLLQSQDDFQKGVLQRLASRRPVYEKAQLQLRVTDPNADLARYLFDYLHSGAYFAG